MLCGGCLRCLLEGSYTLCSGISARLRLACTCRV